MIFINKYSTIAHIYTVLCSAKMNGSMSLCKIEVIDV